jgi:hypothetical protein
VQLLDLLYRFGNNQLIKTVNYNFLSIVPLSDGLVLVSIMVCNCYLKKTSSQAIMELFRILMRIKSQSLIYFLALWISI